MNVEYAIGLTVGGAHYWFPSFAGSSLKSIHASYRHNLDKL